jgi:hypothetical protein
MLFSREEEVWLRAYIATLTVLMGSSDSLIVHSNAKAARAQADLAVLVFEDRFPSFRSVSSSTEPMEKIPSELAAILHQDEDDSPKC